jgi:hypothetical protein
MRRYVDAGATANDARDGYVAVTVAGAKLVQTLLPTLPSSPYVVTYRARDAVSNVQVAYRYVHVINPCAAPANLCTTGAAKGFCQTCIDGECLCLNQVSAAATAEVVVEKSYQMIDATAVFFTRDGSEY